jgi:hypothetical protein
LIEQPTATFRSHTTGKVSSGVEVLRVTFDESDPLRVLVERELARRAALAAPASSNGSAQGEPRPVAEPKELARRETAQDGAR